MIISVEQVRLADLGMEHAGALFKRIDANRSALRNWLAWVDKHTSIDDTRAFITRSREQLTSKDGMSLGLWADDEIVGVAGLHYIDWNDRATSVGFWLAPDYQGRGLMTRAVFGLMKLAFEEYELVRFEGRAAVDNERSRSLFDRLGFRHEGRLRQAQLLPRGYVDHAVYSVIADEWHAMKDRWAVSIEYGE
jgi:ribosomal-protein-serine acetyltransferase